MTSRLFWFLAGVQAPLCLAAAAFNDWRTVVLSGCILATCALLTHTSGGRL